MNHEETLQQAHARAIRAAERQELVDALLDAAGVSLPNEPITQQIPVIGAFDDQHSWLSAS